ncbi:MAG: hypothetical protein J5I59_05925 [Saprospiraceae bacterium]|nr:hypothetical protein [Saprospiraceae bacterium]
MRPYWSILFLVALSFSTRAQEKLLCAAPPMGWNSWNFFEGNISGTIVRQMADAMVANGMKDAGYELIF